MTLRTKTYIAGDWTGDSDLIKKIYEWNEGSSWSLSFSDAHELAQSRDTSLPCSIKRSLKERLDASWTFVLVVGDKTSSLTRGGCRNCRSYSICGHCHRSGRIDHRSFIDYECEYAERNRLRIVVIYNGCEVDREKCPVSVRYLGTHIPAQRCDGSIWRCWDIDGISRAING